jgi:hypothetical protein
VVLVVGLVEVTLFDSLVAREYDSMGGLNLDMIYLEGNSTIGPT